MQLVRIAGKGADARRAGLPCQSPYKGTSSVNIQRARAWQQGWYGEDREIKNHERDV